MALKTLFKFLTHAPLALLLGMNRATQGWYRTGFLGTALSEGLLELLAKGPASAAQIQTALGLHGDRDGLKAWLDLGVALKQLRKTPAGYRLRGRLAKLLSDPANDAWAAYLRVRVAEFYRYIVQTPSMLRQKRKFLPNETYSGLCARSARIVEPFVFKLIDRMVPEKGTFHLLEVGCGTGTYMKRACERNPLVTAIGLELAHSVVELARNNLHAWQLGHRASVQQGDVRQFQSEHPFDLVSLHNLIHCFPLDERVPLLRHAGGYLRPGGRVVLTTLCQGRDPSLASMNLWSTMTDGYGPLPQAGQLCEQFYQAGFTQVHSETIVPGFYLFDAAMA